MGGAGCAGAWCRSAGSEDQQSEGSDEGDDAQEDPGPAEPSVVNPTGDECELRDEVGGPEGGRGEVVGGRDRARRVIAALAADGEEGDRQCSRVGPQKPEKEGQETARSRQVEERPLELGARGVPIESGIPPVEVRNGAGQAHLVIFPSSWQFVTRDGSWRRACAGASPRSYPGEDDCTGCPAALEAAVHG